MGIMCAMTGWSVDTAPLAIQSPSLTERLNPTQPRRKRMELFGINFLLFKHIRVLYGMLCIQRLKSSLLLEVCRDGRSSLFLPLFWNGGSALRVFPRALHLHHEMRRFLLLSLCLVFLCGPLPAADPASLQIHIEEGDGLTYPLGSRATRGITIVVSDEAGNPVDGASVTFGLPETGPSGVFSNESKTE